MEKFLFKKVEMWVLLLIVLICLIGALGFGILVRQEAVGVKKLGMISKAALFLAEMPSNIMIAMRSESADLRAVEQRFDNRSGFVFYNKDYGSDGQNKSLLISRYDGDLGRSLVEFVDLSSKSVVHTWMPDIEAFNKRVPKLGEFEHLDRDHNQRRYRMIHPLLFNDGSLVFHHDSPLVKVDVCGNLIFQIATDVFHHSIQADADGNIWVPTKINPSTIEVFGEKYEDDAITKLSADGEILMQQSVTGILLKQDLQHEIYTFDNFVADPIHLNDIEPVNSSGLYWEKGDVFLSLGHLNMIALYRPSAEKLVWWTQRQLNHQHDIDILNDHEISIFDNNRIMSGDGDVVKGSNEILVYDFATDQMRSLIKPNLRDHDVRTISQGLSEILDNGNIFVEETNYGRLLEFNSDGQLEWEYINRASDGLVYMLNWSRIFTGKKASRLREFLANVDCEEAL